MDSGQWTVVPGLPEVVETSPGHGHEGGRAVLRLGEHLVIDMSGRTGGLEDWRTGGLEDRRTGGLEDWTTGGLEDQLSSPLVLQCS